MLPSVRSYFNRFCRWYVQLNYFYVVQRTPSPFHGFSTTDTSWFDPEADEDAVMDDAEGITDELNDQDDGQQEGINDKGLVPAGTSAYKTIYQGGSYWHMAPFDFIGQEPTQPLTPLTDLEDIDIPIYWSESSMVPIDVPERNSLIWLG